MSIRFVPAMLVAVLVGLVAVGGAALAVGQSSGDADRRDDLLEKTAENLGLDPQALKDALAQAQSELAIERQQELIDRLVEAKVITQEQADEATAWLEARPAAADRIMNDSLFRIAATAAPVVIETHSFGGAFLGSDVEERMAEILGLEPGILSDALDAARSDQAQERRDAVIDEVIAALVEDGQITAAEGDEIKDWLDDMPEWMRDHGVFSGLIAGGAGHLLLPAGPGELRIFPGGVFEGADERFFSPDGTFELPRFETEAFKFPGFEFTVPGGPEDNGLRNRFYYNGPEGEFQFDGEIPEEFRDLFGGFDRNFELPPDLLDLLECHPFLDISPLPETPDSTDESTSDVKGA